MYLSQSPLRSILSAADLSSLGGTLKPELSHKIDLFVCVEVLRPIQPNGVMSSAISLPNHTFIGQA